jgi:NAD(P)H-nitrite reductase large subunit
MEDKVICNCMDITYAELEKKILEQNLNTLELVQEKTEAGTVCGLCVDDISALLDELKKSGKLK